MNSARGGESGEGGGGRLECCERLAIDRHSVPIGRLRTTSDAYNALITHVRLLCVGVGSILERSGDIGGGHQCAGQRLEGLQVGPNHGQVVVGDALLP